ncbi:piriformospora indica-insensitive protein 2-like [Magnolia sinica]|uniref:piriformospora indica-insensitive protein 2-like n=1 Tax=Magnolia sinica TaxID=86752 RepID=UPI00265AE271|nr:piriformospora indica-insensitive protein 2-like [Magnolia sinica]
MGPSLTLVLLFFFHTVSSSSDIQPFLLSPDEQESAYLVLESFNSAIDWRSLFPDDLCLSAPHGVVCDFFPDENEGRAHITELSFGYISDYSSNPPCGPNPHFTPRISSLPFLRKLFFYKCFTDQNISLPGYFWNSSSLQELVFMENPSLVGSLDGNISNFDRLQRLVLSGTGISGNIPDSIGELQELEQLVISRSHFSGWIPSTLGKLQKLKILDLSYNRLEGNLPPEIGGIPELLKLDLGFNQIAGEIPNRLVELQRLEFLDLSYNRFGNFGIPLFLSEMPQLKEVYLSGNALGGQIPEIWEKLGGILGIGLSSLGLVGNIPASMGVYLRNVSYLGLDNNMLEGKVPKEFGLLKNVKEMNLENNRLSGEIPFSANFSAKVGGKLKLEGNLRLCVDSGMSRGHFGDFSACEKKKAIPNAALVFISEGFVRKPSFLLIFVFILFLF